MHNRGLYGSLEISKIYVSETDIFNNFFDLEIYLLNQTFCITLLIGNTFRHYFSATVDFRKMHRFAFWLLSNKSKRLWIYVQIRFAIKPYAKKFRGKSINEKMHVWELLVVMLHEPIINFS